MWWRCYSCARRSHHYANPCQCLHTREHAHHPSPSDNTSGDVRPHSNPYCSSSTYIYPHYISWSGNHSVASSNTRARDYAYIGANSRATPL